jgi:hypothetical protein
MKYELLSAEAFPVPESWETDVRGRRLWSIGLSFALVLIVCVRFFSENLKVVPALVQYIDVPVIAVAMFCGLLLFIRKGYRRGSSRLGVVLFLFVLCCALSALVNSSRIQTLPVLMFVFNFSAPLLFALITTQARLDQRDIDRVLRTFFWLGLVELAVCAAYGLPRFFSTGNPDYVSGTFGQNAYQFTYFMGVWLLYVLGGALWRTGTSGRKRSVSVVVVSAAVFGLFYAAQYRAMLVFFTLVILLSLWVSPAKVSRRVMLTIGLTAVSVISLIVVATSFPGLKLFKVFDLLQDSTPIVQSGKIQAVKNVGSMYEDQPHAALVGSGPATFSSRAYLTFSGKPRPEKGAIGVIAVQLQGGRYATDVAKKYVDSINATPIQGGTTASSPLSSYTSLAAELGIPGLLIYLAAYVYALAYSLRRLRSSARSGDRRGAQLAFTCFGGIVLLLVQTLFDNWLETTRVAIPLWLLIGLLYSWELLPQTERPGYDVARKDGGM